MAHLYQVTEHPEYDGYFTFDGIKALEVPSDFLLLRDDGETLSVEMLYESPEEEALNADRAYHLSNGQEIQGEYTLKKLRKTPELLEGILYVWTEGYPEWMSPSLLPEIEGIWAKLRAKMPPPIPEGSVAPSTETSTPPPLGASTATPPFTGQYREEAYASFAQPKREMRKKNVWEHFVSAFDKKYLTFSGRASRAEYWSFVLFCFIFSWGISILFPTMHAWDMFPWSSHSDLFDLKSFDFFNWENLGKGTFFGNLISSAYALIMFLPSLAVTVRRLHDTNRSPWWFLILLLPVAGWIVMLIFMLQEGQHYTNGYGAIPDDYVLIDKKNRQ